MPELSTQPTTKLAPLPQANQQVTPDILVVSRVFLPDAGGIQEYVYNRCLQDSDRIIVLTSGCAGDQEFDQKQPFSVYRWPELRLCRSWGFVGSIIRQILFMVWAVYLSLKLFQRYRFRYIEWGHGYDFPAILLLSYLLPIQFFLYLHGDDLLCPSKNVLFRTLFQWTLNRSKAYACNSHFTQNCLQRNFQILAPSYIIHPAVRPEKFGDLSLIDQTSNLRLSVRERYNIPADAVVILTVGRLVRRKGFDRVLMQLPSLNAVTGQQIYYIIAGRGSMEAELRELATTLDINHRVIFTGYVPDNQLAALYAASDLFAMLTFFDENSRSIEGFGIVYLEAGYFGKPVVAARVGGVEDAVQDGETGILVNPNSGQEVYQALKLLCSDSTLRERLGRKGQERAKQVTPHRLMYQF
jgi:phosphatidylinositol alpha-1,6-mannosyltransferase